MLNKKILSKAVAFASGFMLLTGCKALHIHDYASPFEYNEAEHWQTCSKCGEKINQDKHYFNNFTDTCMICGYKDPIFVTDEANPEIMTGLTIRGKEKFEHDIPTDIKYIGKGAFKDSNATKINLTKDFIGYYEGAFEGSSVTIISTEEEEVSWELKDGIYYKHDVLQEYDAMIDGVPYKHLSDALRNVKANDTTITLLKDELTLKGSYDVRYVVTLEPYHSKATLHCDFNIYSAGVLNIPASITYTGGIKLLLTNAIERSADSVEDVYTTGAVAFVNRDTAPEGVQVSYVKSFSEDVENGLKAVGSKQVVNSVLVIPVTHYAYGTFAFSKDFKQIKGLSYYGLAVSELYITNIVEGINCSIASHAFAIWGDIKINIDMIADTHIKFYYTKGIFTKVTIADGIESVGYEAFTNWVTDDIFHNIRKMMAPLLSHITSVTIDSNTCKTIDNRAFAQSYMIDEVVVSSISLTSLGEESFYECLNLKTVDLSQGLELNSIGKNAFAACDLLTSVILPINTRWSFGSYFPQDLNPELAAYYLLRGASYTKVGYVGGIYITRSLSTDSFGNYNNVAAVSDMFAALDLVADGGTIYITENIGFPEFDIRDNHLTKSVSIVADPNNKSDIKLGKEGETIEIDSGKYLTLTNIAPAAKISLHSETEEGIDIHNSAGFGIKTTNGEDIPEAEVVYAKTTELKAEGLNAAINSQTYKFYGLYNFRFDQDAIRIDGLSSFARNHGVSRITLGSPISVEKYGIHMVRVVNEAFESNQSLKHLAFTDTTVLVENDAFSDCHSLETVTFGSSVGDICQRAFANCTSLREVRFPKENNLSRIVMRAFKGCDALEYVDLGDNIYGWVATDPRAGGTTVLDPRDLADPKTTAFLLKDMFMECTWVREIA